MKWLILFCAFSVMEFELSAQVARMPLPIVSSKKAAAGSANTLLNNLIAYYKFEDAGNGTRQDATANNHDLFDMLGTYGTGLAKHNSGITNSSVAPQIARLTNSESAFVFSGTNNFSFSMWVRADDVLNNRVLIGKWGTDFSYLLFEVSSVWRFSIRNTNNDASFAANSTVALSAGTTHHIACGFTGTQGWIQVDNETRVLSSTTDGTRPNTSDAFTVGNYASGGSANLGWIDELGIWGRSLTTTEVTTLSGGSYYEDW
jgi:hypothetical protein